MVTIDQIKKISPYLTDAHAQALMGFTSKVFEDRNGAKKFSFERRPEKETEVNPFVVCMVSYSECGELAAIYGASAIEIVLLAEGLLKKE